MSPNEDKWEYKLEMNDVGFLNENAMNVLGAERGELVAVASRLKNGKLTHFHYFKRTLRTK